jgi:LmbE family N-acetylglucosaminyl deacetylase
MNILAFGAHPDDIEIGMGGTLSRFSDAGHNVIGIIATTPPDSAVRTIEARNAAKILGIKIILMEIDFEELYFSRKIVQIIDDILFKYKPDIVFTHWNNDSHQDHNALTNGVIAATRKNNCSVYMYEQTLPGGIVPYSFSAEMYIDISKSIDRKINSIRAHKSQHEKLSDSWIQGVKGRAMYRGSQINTEFAEAFEVIKEIFRIV